MAKWLQVDDILAALLDPELSDLSDLEEDDEEEEIAIPEQQVKITSNCTPTCDTDEAHVSDADSTEDLVEDTNNFQWKNEMFITQVQPFVSIEEVSPDFALSPLQYFRRFVTKEMIDFVVEETNIYSTQKSGASINASPSEIEQLLGMYIQMGLCQMPSIRSYWETNMKYNLVSDIMCRNRFEKLLTMLHFKNNLEATDDEKKNDKLWKLRPWLKHFQISCLQKIPEENHAVDEIMIAFKGRSYLKQYMQNKPTRWGFKMWGRAGASGYLYDFDVYQGATGKTGERRPPGMGLGYDVVMKLTNSLPKDKYFHVFADNFFTSPCLAKHLLQRGIYFLGTIRSNRLKNCNLPEEKEMKKQGRGTVASRVDQNSKIIAVRWFDNKCVTLLSTFVGVEPMDSVQRWDKSKKTHVQVQRPAIIAEYNKFMGGIDKLDMLTTLYKYQIKSRRWYLYIFWHTITIAVVNSWLQYKEECKTVGEKNMPLKKFQAEIAAGLLTSGKGKLKRGRPSSSETTPPSKKKMTKTVLPVVDCQKDKYDHWPLWRDKRGRCKICINMNTFIFCEKCEVYLCLNKERNCFRRFHM